MKLLEQLDKTIPGRFGIQFCSTNLEDEFALLDLVTIRRTYRSCYHYMEYNSDIAATLHKFGRLPICTNEESNKVLVENEKSKEKILSLEQDNSTLSEIKEWYVEAEGLMVE